MVQRKREPRVNLAIIAVDYRDEHHVLFAEGDLEAVVERDGAESLFEELDDAGVLPSDRGLWVVAVPALAGDWFHEEWLEALSGAAVRRATAAEAAALAAGKVEEPGLAAGAHG